jgi:hypothetical protein
MGERDMKETVIGLILMMSLVYGAAYAKAAGETVYDEEGYSYVVPENKKLVVVPWWWNVDRVVYLFGGTKDIVYSDKPVVYGDADGICPPPPPPVLVFGPELPVVDPDC